MTAKTIFDWAMKILSALVIPLIIWGSSLETRLAVQDGTVKRLQEDVKTALALRDALTANTNAQGRLEEKINAINDNLRDIKELLRSPARP